MIKTFTTVVAVKWIFKVKLTKFADQRSEVNSEKIRGITKNYKILAWANKKVGAAVN